MPGANIILDARWSAAVRSTPVELIRPDSLPPLPVSSVEEDLHILVGREMSLERLPEIWLVSRHDYQSSNHPDRACIRRLVFNWHMSSSGPNGIRAIRAEGTLPFLK
jgi:hypothetical protein